MMPRHVSSICLNVLCFTTSLLISSAVSVPTENSCVDKFAKENSGIEWVDGKIFKLKETPAEILHEVRLFQTYMKNYIRRFPTELSLEPIADGARAKLKEQVKNYNQCVKNGCGKTRHGTALQWTGSWFQKTVRKSLDW